MRAILGYVYIFLIHPFVWVICTIIQIILAILSPILAIGAMIYCWIKGDKGITKFL